MDVSTYRKKYDEYRERVRQQQEQRSADLEAGGMRALGFEAFDAVSASEGEDPAAEALAEVRNRELDAEIRAVTLHSISSEIAQREDLIEFVLALLRDTSEPLTLRLEALRILQSLNFSSDLFVTKRADYMATLRELVNTEEMELRERVVEILAQEKDEYALRRLVEGLKDPTKELLHPEKAIPLLRYDIHADYFPFLREIVMKPPSAAARREAIRILGADPTSRDLLANILNNKKESRETRRISALALQALSPEVFEEHARRIVLEGDDTPDLLATSINALTHSKVQRGVREDPELTERVEQLNKRTPSKEVKRAAEIYMSRQSQQDE